MALPGLRPPPFLRHGTKKTTDIVLNVLKAHKDGLTTKELYDEAHATYPDAREPLPPPKPIPTWRSSDGRIIQLPPQPPSDHPLRSIRYLKKVVLKELEEQRWIQKSVTRLPFPASQTKVGIPTMPIWRWTLLEGESDETRRARVAGAQNKNPRVMRRMGSPMRP